VNDPLSSLLIAPVALPLGAALLSLVVPRRCAGHLSLVVGLGLAGLSMVIAAKVLSAGALTHAVGGWGAPLGIVLRADGLSALMLLLTGVLGSAIAVYALGYFRRAPARGPQEEHRTDRFWPVWLFACCGLNGLFLSGDLFNLYVCLEILTLTAISLIAIAGSREAVRAAIRYLQVALAGSLLYLLGVAIVYGFASSLDLAGLAAQPTASSPLRAAWALIVIGLVIKGAVFPAHYWLPPAHSSAPAPVSALLSGLVVTGAFYVILRLWTGLFGFAATSSWSHLMGLIGSASILWGGIQALRQPRLKMVIAYSTVSQVGYGFLLFPLSAGGGEAASFAWNAGVFFALSHGMAKAGAFLAAGALLRTLGHDRVDDLGGTASRHPFLIMSFALAGVSLMGLPPSGGFVAKWMMLKAALLAGQWCYVAVLVAGSLLAIGYLFRVLEKTLQAPAGEESSPAVPRLLSLPAMLLAAAAVALGILSDWPLRLLAAGPLPPSLIGGAL